MSPLPSTAPSPGLASGLAELRSRFPQLQRLTIADARGEPIGTLD